MTAMENKGRNDLGDSRRSSAAGVASVDFLGLADRSALMRRVRSVITCPEQELVKALRAAHLHFETNASDLPGKPDVVFRAKRVAVFVDGEFWHGGQWQRRGLTSLASQFPDKHKRDRWIKKVRDNIKRDLARTDDLLSSGWTVIRLWTGEIERDSSACVDLIRKGITGKFDRSPISIIPERTGAEFFAGIGLARMGLKADGWKVLFANDNAKDKILFYKHNLDEDTLKFDDRDVHKIKSKDIPDVALATACFPCTDLSMAGSQCGLEPGTESSAYLKFTRLLRGMGDRRPPFVLLENVVGMMHSRGGIDFRICLEKLRNAGYSLDPIVVDAKSFVPQSRPRLFIVAIRNDLKPFGHVGIDNLDKVTGCRPKRLLEFIQSNPDLPWSLRPLSEPNERKVLLHGILEAVSHADPRWWSEERTKKLVKQMSKQHKETVVDMMKSRRPKYGTIFRRMRNGKSMAELRHDGIAGCLRTPKGGSAKQILFRACNGKYAARLLTPTECARLMGAEKFRIPELRSTETALFAFGDGVCVPVVRWISEHYLTPLAAELIRGSILSRKTARRTPLAKFSTRRRPRRNGRSD